ncbi:MAG: hypothetical protein DRN15_02720 [Thermoprotei archaeon]|nr:MAG: hypothetical protein DRM97_07795 [Thermoprotei archaeon]RLF24583.1 MAG: hypothetical protein DRN15_02720 [Thermoprotei archaeon]
MPRRLSGTIKEEIRSLVIAPLLKEELLAVVFRGKYWLDGVVRVRVRGDLESIADMVRKLKYYPELRLVILDMDVNDQELEYMNRKLGLPILVVNDRGNVARSIGLSSEELKQLQRVLSFEEEEFIEPIRVTRIIAEALRSFSKRYSLDEATLEAPYD